MDRTRVMLARLPRMLREILERAAEDMRIDVVAVLSDDDDLPSALVQRRAHAIVLGMHGDSPDALVSALLSVAGTLCVMTVSDSGRVATVHRANAAPLTLENLSPRDLLGALEASAGAARTFP